MHEACLKRNLQYSVPETLQAISMRIPSASSPEPDRVPLGGLDGTEAHHGSLCLGVRVSDNNDFPN